MPRTIYFDHNATTPLDPAVRDAMLPFLESVWGNPSSVHHVGRKARALLDDTRERAAKLGHSVVSDLNDPFRVAMLTADGLPATLMGTNRTPPATTTPLAPTSETCTTTGCPAVAETDSVVPAGVTKGW